MGTTKTVFVSDGDREVLEYDGTSGQVLRWYPYGSSLDEALTMVDPSPAGAGHRVMLIPDIEGSIIGALDSAGGASALTKYGYKPFGESNDNVSGAFRYTGRRIDDETGGLHYYRARIYAPALGRFLQPDPIGYAGGANLYTYVGNDPLNAVDPSGLAADAVGNTANKAWGLIKHEGDQIASDLSRDYRRLKDDPLGMISSMANSFPQTKIEGELAAAVVAGVGALKNVGGTIEKGITYLYQKVGAQGEHLKFGVTDNPATRYTAEELAGGKTQNYRAGRPTGDAEARTEPPRDASDRVGGGTKILHPKTDR